MTSTLRSELLNSISNQLDDLSLEESDLPSCNEPLGNVIQFIKSRWGITTDLYYSESLSSEDLFQANRLHLREVQTNSYLVESEKLKGNLLLIITQNSGSLVQYQIKGRVCYYDPSTNKTVGSIDQSVLDNPVAIYEVYRQLPWNIKGPLSVLNVSVSGERTKVILIIVSSLAVMLLGLAVPVLTGYLVQTVIPSTSKSLLIEALIPAFLILVVTIVMNYYQGFVLLLMESGIDLKIQTAVWQKVYKLPMDFFAKYTSGDLLSRVNAITSIRQAMGNQALLSVLQLVFSFVYFVLMWTYDSQLAIGALIISLISICVIIFTLYRQTIHQLPYIEQNAELTNFAYQSIAGIPQIRSTATESFLIRQWFERVKKTVTTQRKIEYWQGFLQSFSTINQTFGTIVLMFLLVYRLVLAKDGSITETQIMAIIVSFLPFYSAYTSFNGQLNSVVNSLSNVVAVVIVQWDRAKTVMFVEEEKGYSPDAIALNIKGKIDYTGVSYSFDTSKPPLFSDITFSVPAGTFTAIAGESGCGKSTMMRLLLGFISPSQGTVQIDGYPLDTLNIRHYRRQLGVVLQSTKLPPGSIYDIVCAGRNFSEDRVWEVLETCAVADQIKQFPMGLETIITESPAISGGQRQRIGMARAIISKPKILILDEATSALDAETQKVITDNINNMGITRICIAHRLSTIRSADQIIVIKNKTLFAKGTYDELYKQDALINTTLIQEDQL